MIPDDPARESSPHSRLDRSSTFQATSDGRSGVWNGAGAAWIMVAELISATLTWGGIGWLLDRWLHTRPWLLIVGLVVGNVAGFYLVYLRSQNLMTAARKPWPATGGNHTGQTTEGPAHGTD
jgi:F0F1-type ATP synthase assembly protein I